MEIPEKIMEQHRKLQEQFKCASEELNILEEAQKAVYGDRETDYGSVKENFSKIAKGWELILGQPVTPEQVGLCMVWLKMARQMNKGLRDNLVDIAGYVACLEKMENETNNEKSSGCHL